MKKERKRMYRCAAVQTDPRLGDKRANLTETLRQMEKCAAAGARLVVFPECGLTGYCFDGRSEALALAEEIPGPSTEALAAKARETGVYVLAGLLEREGDALYNAAVLIGPEGALLHAYRKTHLPPIGVDRFADAGEGPLEVVETPIGRVGVLICYDLFFPEAARTLRLKGMDLLLLPTNWPAGLEASPDFVVRCRARENQIHVVAANRGGVERGIRFIGRSQICGPDGAVLAEAAPDGEDVIRAEIAPRSRAEGGDAEGADRDRLLDRRPDLYEGLSDAREEAPLSPGFSGAKPE